MENQSQAIGGFIDKLIEEKNFGSQDIDGEVLQQIKIDLTDRVEDRINATILENMPAEKMEEFNAILDQDDSQAIQNFCQHNIPNLAEVIAQALAEFRDTYLKA